MATRWACSVSTMNFAANGSCVGSQLTLQMRNHCYHSWRIIGPALRSREPLPAGADPPWAAARRRDQAHNPHSAFAGRCGPSIIDPPTHGRRTACHVSVTTPWLLTGLIVYVMPPNAACSLYEPTTVPHVAQLTSTIS